MRFVIGPYGRLLRLVSNLRNLPFTWQWATGTIYFLFALGPFLYLGAKILISAIDGPSKLSRNSMIAWCMCGIAAALTIYSLAKLILWESSNINTGSGVQYVVFALGSPLGFSFLHCLYLRLRCC